MKKERRRGGGATSYRGGGDRSNYPISKDFDLSFDPVDAIFRKYGLPQLERPEGVTVLEYARAEELTRSGAQARLDELVRHGAMEKAKWRSRDGKIRSVYKIRLPNNSPARRGSD